MNKRRSIGSVTYQMINWILVFGGIWLICDGILDPKIHYLWLRVILVWAGLFYLIDNIGDIKRKRYLEF